MTDPAKKVFVKVEKKLACDLEPGELFVVDFPDPDYFRRELNNLDVALPVLLRTNVSADDIEDKETIVYVLNIIVATSPDEERVLSKRIDPYTPPGMKPKVS